MPSPHVPLGERYQAIGYSVVTILWWVGIWGLADTVIHMVFKGAKIMELGVYVIMISIVLLLVFIEPSLVKAI